MKIKLVIRRFNSNFFILGLIATYKQGTIERGRFIITSKEILTSNMKKLKSPKSIRTIQKIKRMKVEIAQMEGSL
jgi:hypothetical protein